MTLSSFRLLAAAVILTGGVGASLPASPAAAFAPPETPRTAAAVPLFPGLTPAGEKPMSPDSQGLQDGWGDAYPMIEGTSRTYVTTAAAEDVFAFYQQRLGGKSAWTEADDHNHIGPGQVTPVMQVRRPYEFRGTDNPLLRRLIPASSQRAMLEGGRPSSSQGDWIKEGTFGWVVKDRTGAPTAIDVQIVDESVSANWSGYSPRTVVTIHVARYGLINND